jgi:CelD/BcsL family acetyltransferase involved in cellulose biosynthesis
MITPLQVETMSPRDLAPAERASWKAWASADPCLSSPYFQPEYAEAAHDLAPGAAVAVLKRDGRIEGFLPFQRRGDEIQPLGAPLTDYHGPILRPGAKVDLAEVVFRLGGDIFCFTGFSQPDLIERGPTLARQAMAADLEGGFEAYMARRQAEHPRFFKARRRQEAALVRDHGEIGFSFGPEPDGALDWIIEGKRRQYRRTGQHDIFACGWTEKLLRRLTDEGGREFGPRFAVLRVGERIVAAEMSLVAGETCHLWFPVYDVDFARYGPGMLMTVKTLEAAAAEGLRYVDFGPGGEDYKHYFADPTRTVLEGRLIAKPWRTTLSRALAESYASGLGAKLGRRLHVMSACETSVAGWTRGLASAAAASAGRIRYPRAAVALAATAPALAADVAELATLV